MTCLPSARRISYRPTWTYDLTAPVTAEQSPFCEKSGLGRALTGSPGDVRPLTIDVTAEDSVAAAATVAAGAPLDVLVNNAGIAGTWTSALDTTPADFIPVFGVNLLGPVRVIRAFVPLMRAADHPRIVDVSSGMGVADITTDPGRMSQR